MPFCNSLLISDHMMICQRYNSVVKSVNGKVDCRVIYIWWWALFFELVSNIREQKYRLFSQPWKTRPQKLNLHGLSYISDRLYFEFVFRWGTIDRYQPSWNVLRGEYKFNIVASLIGWSQKAFQLSHIFAWALNLIWEQQLNSPKDNKNRLE